MTQTKIPRLVWAAALAALVTPAWAVAQEDEPQQEHQITVRLIALGATSVSGDIALRPQVDERQEMSTEPQPVDLAFNVQGLEPNQEVRLLVHQGPCSTGVTTVAEIGRYTADDQGALSHTETVTSDGLWQALHQAGSQQPEADEAQAYHLQLEGAGQPIACGNFNSGSM